MARFILKERTTLERKARTCDTKYFYRPRKVAELSTGLMFQILKQIIIFTGTQIYKIKIHWQMLRG